MYLNYIQHIINEWILFLSLGLFGKAKKKFVKTAIDSNGEAVQVKGADFSYISKLPQAIGNYLSETCSVQSTKLKCKARAFKNASNHNLFFTR